MEQPLGEVAFSRDVADRNLLRVTKQTTGVMTFQLLGTALGLGSNVVFARLLGPDLLGVYVLGWTVLLVASLVASVGMGFTFVRFVPVRLARGDVAGAADVFRFGMKIVFWAGVGCGIVLFLARGLFAGPVFHDPRLLDVLPLVALGAAPAALHLVLGQTLRALRRAAQEALCTEVVYKVVKFGVFLALAYAGLRLLGITIAFVGAYVASAGLMLLLLTHHAPHLIRGPRTRSIPRREIALFSATMLFVGLMNYGLSMSDRIMLGILGTAEDVGIYNVAFLLSNILMLVFMGFNASFAPVISELYHGGRHEELRSLYSSLTRGVIIIVAPALCWLVGFGDDVLTIFGDAFTEGYVALAILCGGVAIRCAIGSVGTLLVMSGHPKFNAANAVAVALLNVALNWFLIPRFGLVGAAAATTLSIALIDTVGLIEVRILINILPFRRGYVKLLAAGAVTLAATLLVRATTPAVSLPVVCVVLLAAYALFLGLLAAMGLERDDRLIVGRILARLRRALRRG